MLVCRTPLCIEWGQCDPAGITFYPNYFTWFDVGTWHLFALAGLPPKDLASERGVYLALVDARAHFHRPGFLGDELMLESEIAEWRDRFFLVRHKGLRAGELILEGEELRAWATRHPDDARRFSAIAIPDAVKQAFLEKGEAS